MRGSGVKKKLLGQKKSPFFLTHGPFFFDPREPLPWVKKKAPVGQKKSPPVLDIVPDSEEEAAASASVADAAAVSDSGGAGGVKPPPTVEDLQVPKTIRDEWARIERLWHDGETDAPRCSCPTCPYSAGGPLTNRHHLIERLIELEHYLWGR